MVLSVDLTLSNHVSLSSAVAGTTLDWIQLAASIFVILQSIQDSLVVTTLPVESAEDTAKAKRILVELFLSHHVGIIPQRVGFVKWKRGET